MTPQQILTEAAALLERPTPSLRRCWQRGCACLTRLALEQGLHRYWERVAPPVAGCPMRHQLLALPAFVDAETARLARTAWYGLSRATHHHSYELPATLAELRSWHRDVLTLLDRLDVAAQRRPQRQGRAVHTDSDRQLGTTVGNPTA